MFSTGNTCLWMKYYNEDIIWLNGLNAYVRTERDVVDDGRDVCFDPPVDDFN